MVKSLVRSLMIASALLLSGCAQNTSSVQPVGTPEASFPQSNPDLVLPGLDRLVFDDTGELAPQVLPITCGNQPTGPLYREQTRAVNLNDYNLIQFDVYLPDPQNNDPYYPYVYTGGDTKDGNGALDAGIFPDNSIKYQGHPTWSPFINYTGPGHVSALDDKIPDNGQTGFSYGLIGNQTITFAMWISSDKHIIKISAKGKFIEISKTTGLPNSDNSSPFEATRTYYLYTAVPTLWQKNAVVAYKLMTTVGIKGAKPFNFSVNSSNQALTVEGVRFIDNTIKLGKLDAKGTISNMTAWADLSYNTGRTKNPCPAPDDMVVPSGSHSAKITLRVISKFNLSPLPISPLSGAKRAILTGSLQIKNIGPTASLLYYYFDTSTLGGGKTSGKLAPDQSIPVKYSLTCPDKTQAITKDVDIFYSENETIDSNNIQVAGLPDTFSKASGGILYRKYTASIRFNCGVRQVFKINAVDLYGLVRQTVTGAATLSVASTEPGRSIVGGYDIAFVPPVTTPAGLLSTQSIVVSPIVTPSSVITQTAENALSISATCGETSETKLFQYDVTDPTGNTIPTTYTITLHCLGPKMTAPTPSPLNLSSSPDAPAGGSFSFKNLADATPDGQRALLKYSAVASSGLTLSSSGGTLAGGETATFMVTSPCNSPETIKGTVTVTSDDPNRQITTIPVLCLRPILGGPTPSPLALTTVIRVPIHGSFITSNVGTADLTYKLTGGTVWLSIDSALTGTIVPGGTAVIAVTVTCPIITSPPSNSASKAIVEHALASTALRRQLVQVGRSMPAPLVSAPPTPSNPPVTYDTTVAITSNTDPAVVTEPIRLLCAQPKLREANGTSAVVMALPGHRVQQHFALHNDGSSPLTYSLSSDTPWLSITSPSSGMISPSQSVNPGVEAICPPNVFIAEGSLTLQTDDPLAPTVKVNIQASCHLVFFGFDVNAAPTGQGAGTSTGFDTFFDANITIPGMSGTALAVDASGNLWGVFQDTLVMVPADQLTYPGTPQPVFVTSQGLHHPRSLAFDVQGNLWVANDSDTDGTNLIPATYYNSSAIVVFPAASLTPGSGAAPITVISSASAFGKMSPPTSGVTDRPYLVRAATINFGPNRHLWITDDSLGRQTTLEYGPLGLVPLGNPEPLSGGQRTLADGGLTFDGVGGLWISNDYYISGPNHSYNLSGRYPTALAFDQEHNLWSSSCGDAIELRASDLASGTSNFQVRIQPALQSGLPGCIASIAFDPPVSHP